MLVDIAVPVLSIRPLTYDAPVDIPEGSRVIVEVGKTLRCGFILEPTKQKLPASVKIKPISGIIDAECVIDRDIWELALWLGKVSMSGVNAALKAVLPKKVIEGDKLEAPQQTEARKDFHEINYFNPFDDERVNFFIAEANQPGRTLILFPTRSRAKAFHALIPEALFWPYGKIFPAWTAAHLKQCRILIGPPGAVFAPLKPDRIIIDDEANPAYILPNGLHISARSIAGQRAMMLGAELITGGRIPSLKTYLRTRPKPEDIPERKNIILADMENSRKEEEPGITGTITLTETLIRRTYQELAGGRNVIWILNRLGEASEVFCDHCGRSILCPNCGRVMRSIINGTRLHCRACGVMIPLPKKCVCGHELFTGKRPGIEALAKIADKYYPDVNIYLDGSDKRGMKGLIVSTQRGLELCDWVNPSLVAWLELDTEIRRPEYSSRWNIYCMLYESYYRGRKRSSDRKVIIQAHSEGMKLARFLAEGWGKFIPDELRIRRDFMMPPYSYTVDVDTGSKIDRRDIISRLEDSGLFVMDPGNDKLPLSVNTTSLEPVIKALNPPDRYLKITVRSE